MLSAASLPAEDLLTAAFSEELSSQMTSEAFPLLPHSVTLLTISVASDAAHKYRGHD